MISFGPAGRDDEMIANKIVGESIANELAMSGLTCFEYPFTFGVKMSSETALVLKNSFASNNIAVSVHAPYYINLAQSDLSKIEASFTYIIDSMQKAKEMGSDRVVFHPGSLTKQTREDAQKNIEANLRLLVESIKEKKIEGVYLCPETMGKHGQLGTVEEVARMCQIDEMIIPTLDFGHINAFNLGALKTEEDYDKIFDLFINKLGKKEIHVHFSRIEFGSKGELRHLTFDSELDFGPDYKTMINSAKKFDANIRVICESAGTQKKDSIIMQNYYKKVF